MGASRLLVLIACEFSGTVRDAFIRAGHDAFSVDILPSESDFGPHIQGDALAASQVLPWDLMIAHPPCTYLTYAGAKHLYIDGRKENGRNEDRWKKMREAALFFRNLLQAKIPRVAIENPIMLDVAQQIVGRSADQFIQPYQFGHRERVSAPGYIWSISPNSSQRRIYGWRRWRFQPRSVTACITPRPALIAGKNAAVPSPESPKPWRNSGAT